MPLFIQDESDEEWQLELSRIEEERPNQNKLPPNEFKTEIYSDSDKECERVLYPLIPRNEKAEKWAPNLKDIRPVDIQLSVALPFQQIILENLLVSENCLLVMGKGMGIITIVSNLVHVLSTPVKVNDVNKRSLVLLLNASDNEIKKIQGELMELSWLSEDRDEREFLVINSDSHTVSQRMDAYTQGGIIAVTSRILVVDLLSGIIHPNLITGLLIMNSEQLDNYSTESFIAEIYNDMNNWGFIKAVTDSPESLVYEFSPLMRKMKDLRLSRTLLWPRFHSDVLSSLNFNKTNSVIEVKVSLTDSMSKIHFGLLECLKKCVEELSRKMPDIAKETWNSANAIDSNFMKSIHAELQPKWHRISYESKQLVKDISTLRRLLHALLSYDAVDFYELIQIILDANKPSISRKYSESPWLLVAESQLVISYSKKRVYHNNQYLLEELPKWEQLNVLLKDINYERAAKPSQHQGPTLIMCSDELTLNQLRNIIAYAHTPNGSRQLLINKLQGYINRRDSVKYITKEIHEQQQVSDLQVSRAFSKEEVVSKRRRTRGAAAVAAVSRLHNASDIKKELASQISSEDLEQEREKLGFKLGKEPNSFYNLIDDDDDLAEYHVEFENEPEIAYIDSILSKQYWYDKKDNFSYINSFDSIILECYNSDSGDSLLYELMPSFVIIYEPNLSFIRNLEVFKASHTDTISKIYFMYYGDSVEEQKHLLNIKKEKDAFTKIIRENTTSAQHFETRENLSRYRNLVRRKLQLRGKKNSRIAGGQAAFDPVTKDIVIVDIREFRAPLAGILYRYGVKVVPCMLTIGDYIISPKICIERKSIADLIASFKNGRLIKQCRQMCKYYDIPTLLLEFDDNKSFSLEPFGDRGYLTVTSSTVHPISSKLMQEEVQMGLSVLVLKFPNLKIIWSSSPLQTVNIILSLKAGREQPDPSICVEIGKTSTRPSESQSTSADQTKFKELLTIPGFSSIDYYNIKKRCKSYKNLQSLTVEKITTIVMDRVLAEKIYSHIQKELELESVD